MKLKRSFCRGFLNLAVLCTIGSVHGFTQQPPPGKPVRVACMGDSITAGYGLQKGEKAYPRVLQELLGRDYKVQAYGASGRTFLKNGDMPYWKTQALSQAAAIEPDVVVIALGTNDAKPGNFAKVAELPNDAAEMIRYFKDLPSKPVVFLALPAPVYRTNYGIIEENLVQVRALLAETAKKENVPVIDLFTALSNHPGWFPDGVHPNAEGAEALAKKVAASLHESLKK